MKKSLFEQVGGTYHQEGDYLLPQLSSPLTGDVQNYEIFMEVLRRTSPVPIGFKPLEEHLDGFFSSDSQSITLREGMSEVQTICAAVHEITHSLLHNREKDRLSAVAGTDQAEKVKYNRAEHPWDCPCHGSRFREDGAPIGGPTIRRGSGNIGEVPPKAGLPAPAVV